MAFKVDYNKVTELDENVEKTISTLKLWSYILASLFSLSAAFMPLEGLGLTLILMAVLIVLACAITTLSAAQWLFRSLVVCLDDGWPV